MWTSTKLSRCRAESIPEYPWIYGIADANGNFELTDLRVIYGKAYSIRPAFSFEQFLSVLEDFQANGLLFKWEEDGKTYGHWTGSELPGRLPSKEHRKRYEQVRCQRSFSPGDAEVAEYIRQSLAPKPQNELFKTKFPSPFEVRLNAKENLDKIQERANIDDPRLPAFKKFWELYPENFRGSYSDTMTVFNRRCLNKIEADECVELLLSWKASEQWQTLHIPNSEKFFDKDKYKAAPPPPKEPNGRGTSPITRTVRDNDDRVGRILRRRGLVT